jgi:hypothetical protein
MQSSNLAARMDHAAPDLLIEALRPTLQVITNSAPFLVRKTRTRASFETRTIVIRDPGFKTFRVF